MSYDEKTRAPDVPSLTPLNLAEINCEFRLVAAKKGWQEYHNPKNLACAIAVEASKLLAEFQWLSEKEARHLGDEGKSRVADEIADIVMYLTELSMQLHIDLATAMQVKIEKNKVKFS